MAFTCLQPKTGAILIAVLNLIIGLPVLVQYFLGYTEYMNSFSKTVHKYSGPGGDNSTANINPFDTTTTTTTTTPTPESDNDECSWFCLIEKYAEPFFFYVGYGFMLLFLLAGIICCIISAIVEKNKLRYAKAAYILTGGLIVFSAINCGLMFVLGLHWLDLIPLFVWCFLVQLYFAVVLSSYSKTIEFQRVPVQA